jgi:hypothetical protein
MWRQLKKRAAEEAHERRQQRETYTTPLEVKGVTTPEEVRNVSDFLWDFKKTFKQNTTATQTFQAHAIVQHFHEDLVVSTKEVLDKEFWQRYFYRCDEERIFKRLEKEKPLKLKEHVKKIISDKNNNNKVAGITTTTTTAIPATATVPATPAPAPAPAAPTPELPLVPTSPQPSVKETVAATIASPLKNYDTSNDDNDSEIDTTPIKFEKKKVGKLTKTWNPSGSMSSLRSRENKSSGKVGKPTHHSTTFESGGSSSGHSLDSDVDVPLVVLTAGGASQGSYEDVEEGDEPLKDGSGGGGGGGSSVSGRRGQLKKFNSNSSVLTNDSAWSNDRGFTASGDDSVSASVFTTGSVNTEKLTRKEQQRLARLQIVNQARNKAQGDLEKAAEEEAQRKLEEDIRKEEERVQKEEQVRQRALEEAKRKAEWEARRKAEEAARQKAQDDARLQAEVEARKRAFEEAKQRAQAEERRKAEEEQARIKAGSTSKGRRRGTSQGQKGSSSNGGRGSTSNSGRRAGSFESRKRCASSCRGRGSVSCRRRSAVAG